MLQKNGMAELHVNIDVTGYDGLNQVGSTMRLIDKLAGDNKLYFATQESRKAFIELVSEAQQLEAEMSKTQNPKAFDSLKKQLGNVQRQISDYTAAAVYGSKVIGGDFTTAISKATEELRHNQQMIETVKAKISDLGAMMAATKAGPGVKSEEYKAQVQELNRLHNSLDNYKANAKNASANIESLRAAQAAFRSSSIAASGSIEEFVKRLQQVPTVGQQVQLSLRNVKGMLGDLSYSLIGGFGLEQFIQKVFTTRSQFQQLEVSFTTMLGDVGKAKGLMDQLIDTAAKTPFDMMTITQGAKQLLAYGTAANEVNGILTRLGDISAGLSIPLNDLVWLYGTTMTQGRMYTQDLRQFMGRGIPMAEELAKQFGVSKDEVGKLVTQGKVGADNVKQAIIDMTSEGGKFGGLMEKQSHTLQGQWSNIGDTIDQMINEIGKKTEGVFNSALDFISAIISNWETVGKVIGVAVTAIGAYKTGLMVAASMQKREMLGGLNDRIRESQMSIVESRGSLGGAMSVSRAQKAIRNDFAKRAADNLDESLDETLRKEGERLEKEGLMRSGLTDEIMKRREIARQMEAQADLAKEDVIRQKAKTEAISEEARKREVAAQAERQRRIEEAQANADRLRVEADNARNSGFFTAYENNQQAEANVISAKSRLADADKSIRSQQDFVGKLGGELGEAANFDPMYQAEIEKLEELRTKRKQAKDEYVSAIAQQKLAYQSLVEEVYKMPGVKESSDQYLASKAAYEQDKADLEVQEQKLAVIKAQIETQRNKDISDVAVDEGGGLSDAALSEADALTNLESQRADIEQGIEDTKKKMVESYNSMHEAQQAFKDAQADGIQRLKDDADAAEEAAGKAQELTDALRGSAEAKENDTEATEGETTAQSSANTTKARGASENAANTVSEDANSTAKAKNATASTTNGLAQTKENTSKTLGKAANTGETVSQEVNTAAKAKNTLATKVSEFAIRTWKGAVDFARVSLDAFTLALARNPFTAILTAITTVVSLLMTFSGILDLFSSKEDESMKSMGEAADSATTKTKTLFAQLQVVGENSQTFRNVMSELTEEYKQYGIQLDETIMKMGTEDEKKQELLKHQRELIEAIRTEAIEREKANQIEGIEKDYSDKKNKVWSDNLEDTGLDNNQITSIQLTLEDSKTFEDDMNAREEAWSRYMEVLKAASDAQQTYGVNSAQAKQAVEERAKAFDTLTSATARSENALIKLAQSYGQNISKNDAHAIISRIMRDLGGLNDEHGKVIRTLEEGAKGIDGYNQSLVGTSKKSKDAAKEQEKLSYWSDKNAKSAKAAADGNNDFGDAIHSWVDASVAKANINLQNMSGIMNGVVPIFDKAGKQIGTLPPLLDMTSTSSQSAADAMDNLSINAKEAHTGFGDASISMGDFASNADAATGQGTLLNSTLNTMWGTAGDAKAQLETMVPSTLDPKDAFPKLLALQGEVEDAINWVSTHPISPEVKMQRLYFLNSYLGLVQNKIRSINGQVPIADRIQALQDHLKKLGGEKANKQNVADYKRTQKEIEKLQGETVAGKVKADDKAAKSAASKAKSAASKARTAAEQERRREKQQQDSILRAKEDYSKTLVEFIKNEKQTDTDTTIKLMEDGNAKELAQIKNDTQKQLDALDERYKRLADAKKKLAMTTWINQGKGKEKRTEQDWKKTSEGGKDDTYWMGLIKNEHDKDTGMSLGTLYDKQQTFIYAEQERQIKKLSEESAKSMNDYLKNYGSMQEQRLAIAKEYDDKIAKARTVGDRLTLQAEKDRALSEFDIKNQKSELNWEDIFGNLGTFSKKQLQGIKGRLKEMLSSDDLDIEGYKEIVGQIDKVNDAIITAEDKQRGFLGVAVSYNQERRKLEMDVADASERQAEAYREMLAAQAGLSMERFSMQQQLGGMGVDVKQDDVTASNAKEILQKVGDKHGVGSEQYKKAQQGFDKLAKSEAVYNDAVSKNTKATTDAATANRKLKDYLSDFAKKLNDLMPLFEQINANIQDIPGLLSQFGVSEDSSLGKGAQALADGANSSLSAIKDYESGNYVGAVMNGMKAVGSYVQSATNIFAGAGNEKKMEAEIARLGESNEVLAGAIDSLKDRIQDSNNTNQQSLEAYKKALEAEKQREANQRTRISDRAKEYSNSGHGFLGMGGKKSFDRYADKNKGNWLDDFNKALRENGYEGNLASAGDVWKLSPEEMKVLRDFSPEAWTNFFNSGGQSNPKDLVEEYLEMADKQKELTDSLNEKLTGYSLEGFRDSYESLLEDLTSDTGKFGDNINAIINKAVTKSIVNSKKHQKEIEDIYQAIADAASDDNITEEEANKIRKMNEDLAKELQAERKAAIEAGLITEDSYSQKASSGTFQTMSQETGNELSGRFTAIQIAVEGILTQVTQINGKSGIGTEAESLPVSVDNGSSTMFDNLKVNTNDLCDIANEGRTILAQSLMELQEINERQSGWDKPLKTMWGYIKDMRDDIRNKL